MEYKRALSYQESDITYYNNNLKQMQKVRNCKNQLSMINSPTIPFLSQINNRNNDPNNFPNNYPHNYRNNNRNNYPHINPNTFRNNNQNNYQHNYQNNYHRNYQNNNHPANQPQKGNFFSHFILIIDLK